MSENTHAPGVDPLIAGELLAEEGALLRSLRDQMNGYLLEIGQLEVAKARLLGAIQQTEQRANHSMKQIGQRLELPENSKWQITPDNKVRLLPQSKEA